MPLVDDDANGDVEIDGDAGVDAADDQTGGVDSTIAAIAIDPNVSDVIINLTTIINNITHSIINTARFTIITINSSPASLRCCNHCFQLLRMDLSFPKINA